MSSESQDEKLARRKNLSLILLSLVFLPLDTFFVICTLISCYISNPSVEIRRAATRQRHGFVPKVVLVTGVGMSKGLAIARSFYEAGHDVIGADFESDGALVCGRFSKSLKKFYQLQAPNDRLGPGPYVESLLRIVRCEEVNIWISCSGVASAIEDGQAKEIIEARTSCKAVQFDTATTQTLHEKNSFIERTKEVGLTVPDTHYVTSYEAAEAVLRKAPGDRKYIMKPVGMDDANRGDLTLLPKATDDETSAHLSKLQISKESSWILQQYISGPEYCTHSVVIKGQVKAFVACPSAELLMHYEALPKDSKLHQAMLQFTRQYASYGGKRFSGHLSFDFMVEEAQMAGPHSIRKGEDPVLHPIECNPRAHTAVVLFNQTSGLPDAYLSLLDATNLAELNDRLIEPRYNEKYYWIGHDLVELLLLPILSLFLDPGTSVTDLLGKFSSFVNHIIDWRDGTFERWDPVPWWWLYHGYWPMRFLQCLRKGMRWSRVNVSTTKMFEY